MGPQFLKLFKSSSVTCTTMASSGRELLMVAGVSLVVVCPLKGVLLVLWGGWLSVKIPLTPTLAHTIQAGRELAKGGFIFHLIPFSLVPQLVVPVRTLTHRVGAALPRLRTAGTIATLSCPFILIIHIDFLPIIFTCNPLFHFDIVELFLSDIIH